MGTPTDLVADVIRGNLAGAEANIELTQAKIDELAVELARFTSEAAEYRQLLQAHETQAAAIRGSEVLAVAQEVE